MMADDGFRSREMAQCLGPIVRRQQRDPRKIVALEGFGIEIVEQTPVNTKRLVVQN